MSESLTYDASITIVKYEHMVLIKRFRDHVGIESSINVHLCSELLRCVILCVT